MTSARVAADVGGTTTRVAVVDGSRVVRRLEQQTARPDVAEQLASMIRELGVAPAAVGVAVPGPLSADGRAVAFTGNLDLRDYPLAELLERKLGCVVQLDDDANCAALGEARLGAAAATRSSVTIVVGTGIGAGVVVDDHLLRGAHRTAGELGHVRVAPGGRRCSCGRDGCLEAMANGAALAERVPEAADAAAVFAAARSGDHEALAAVEEAAGWLAVGVAAVGSLLDPECIVLAGGVGRQPELVELVQRLAPPLCIEPIGANLDIRAGLLGDDAGLLGAAALVTEPPEVNR